MDLVEHFNQFDWIVVGVVCISAGYGTNARVRQRGDIVFGLGWRLLSCQYSGAPGL